MARVNNLSNFLGDVANAIRTKKETTGQIPAENFDQEILSIDTIKGQEKTIIPSTAEQIITPDGDYNAITKATVKAVDSTIDSNISPENIKKDINILGVTGTLEQINNQDKEITTNGTYTADEGYTGLGTVTVNVPQTGDIPVKLFETQEEMQADTEAKEGDLAIVYRNLFTPISTGSTYREVWFPETVILPQVVSETYTSGNTFRGVWTLSPTSMTLVSRFGGVNISYTSIDGQTYNRTDTTSMPISLMSPLSADANSLFTYFCTIRDIAFEGVYTYSSISQKDINSIQALANCTYPDTATISNVDMADIIQKFNQEIDESQLLSGISKTYVIAVIEQVVEGKATEVKFYLTQNGFGIIGSNDIQQNGYLYQNYNTSSISTVDYNVVTVTTSSISYSAYTTTLQSNIVNWSLGPDVSNKYITCFTLDNNYNISGLSSIKVSGLEDNSVKSSSIKCLSIPKYFLADTQLNLSNSNQLLPNYKAYGSSGIITGSEDVYDNLNARLLFNHKSIESDSNCTQITKIGDTIDSTKWLKSITFDHQGDSLVEIHKSQTITAPDFYREDSKLVYFYYDYEKQKEYAVYLLDRVFHAYVYSIKTNSFESYITQNIPDNIYSNYWYGKLVDDRYLYFQSIEYGASSASPHYKYYYDYIYKFDFNTQTCSLYKTILASDKSTRKWDYSRPCIYDYTTDTWFCAYQSSTNTSGIYKVTSLNSTPQLVKSLTYVDGVYLGPSCLSQKYLPYLNSSKIGFYNITTGESIDTNITFGSSDYMYVSFDVEDVFISVTNNHIFKISDGVLTYSEIQEVPARANSSAPSIQYPVILDSTHVQVYDIIIDISTLEVSKIKPSTSSSYGRPVVTFYDSSVPTEISYFPTWDPYYTSGIPSTIYHTTYSRYMVNIFDSLQTGDYILYYRGQWYIRNRDLQKLQEYEQALETSNEILN